uniref:4-alpha-glucanotransferase n=1 Tax=Aegilops tauschii subsp. strangulata TaxID=200361 RepID=A0A453B122_AEGTS
QTGNHFCWDKNGFPTFVSGVPPDAFSKTGQLWNSPLYDWKSMEADGFAWWVKRIKRALDLYDEFRIDHFRGLAGFWAVPSGSEVAMFGSWRAGPRNAFFDALFKAVGRINIIAEDLGVITEDVVELRKSIGAPGMAVLQFAFGGGPGNPHLPHNHELNQVVYTGTHDNDTGCWLVAKFTRGREANCVQVSTAGQQLGCLLGANCYCSLFRCKDFHGNHAGHTQPWQLC